MYVAAASGIPYRIHACADSAAEVDLFTERQFGGRFRFWSALGRKATINSSSHQSRRADQPCHS